MRGAVAGAGHGAGAGCRLHCEFAAGKGVGGLGGNMAVLKETTSSCRRPPTPMHHARGASPTAGDSHSPGRPPAAAQAGIRLRRYTSFCLAGARIKGSNIPVFRTHEKSP